MSAAARPAPALPDSLLRSALPRALEHLRTLEDPGARLSFGAEVLTMILAAAEELEQAELELKTILGLSALPDDLQPDRGRPPLPERPRLVVPAGRPPMHTARAAKRRHLARQGTRP